MLMATESEYSDGDDHDDHQDLLLRDYHLAVAVILSDKVISKSDY